jgi:hypothetical protein
MKIEISTEFETSHIKNYQTKITARIVNDKGVVLCEGKDTDSWPDPNERRASALNATRDALSRFQQLLDNARDVAQRSGLA